MILEGSSFRTVGENQSYDIEYWRNKTCRCCGEKGHPGWIHTPEEQAKSRKAQQEKKRKKIKEESKESDEESVGSTKTKKSTKSATSKSASKQQATLEEAAKAFATVMVANMDTHNEGDDSDTYSY
jgi:outer membrane biosynthesis protein TonB